MKARLLADLQKLSDAKLTAEHDELVKATGGVGVGVQYYLDELRYRRQERVASRQERVTSQNSHAITGAGSSHSTHCGDDRN